MTRLLVCVGGCAPRRCFRVGRSGFPGLLAATLCARPCSRSAFRTRDRYVRFFWLLPFLARGSQERAQQVQSSVRSSRMISGVRHFSSACSWWGPPQQQVEYSPSCWDGGVSWSLGSRSLCGPPAEPTSGARLSPRTPPFLPLLLPLEDRLSVSSLLLVANAFSAG